MVADFKYNNREFRGRGRPSIWTPYRSEDNESESDFNVDKRRNNAKRKAIKTKMNTESVSIPHILWNEELIDSIKRAKEKKALRKKQKSQLKTEIKTEKNIEIKTEKTAKKEAKPKNAKKSKSGK